MAIPADGVDIEVGDEYELDDGTLEVKSIVARKAEDLRPSDIWPFVDPNPSRFLNRFNPIPKCILIITLSPSLEDLFDSEDPTYEKIYRSGWDD